MKKLGIIALMASVLAVAIYVSQAQEGGSPPLTVDVEAIEGESIALGDPQAGAPADGHAGGLSSSSGPADGNAPAEPAPRELRIFRLKHIPAADLLNAVKDLYREEFDGQLPAAVDEGSNSLLVRSSREFQAEIEALARELDQPAANPAGGRSETPVPTGGGQPAANLLLSNKAAANNNPLSLWDGDRSTLQALANDYEAKNQESLELSSAVRKSLKMLKPDGEKAQNLQMRLQKAVEAAFDARQRWHQAEIAALRARLQPLETLVASREQAREEIIKARVEFLLRPERQWDAPGGRPGQSGDSQPGGENRSGGTMPPGVPQPKGTMSSLRSGVFEGKPVWTTDFSEATERARTIHRPLVVLFTASESSHPDRGVIEQLKKPEALAFLAPRFVTVHVDVDSDAGKKVARRFDIKGFPTVLALTPSQEIIHQWGGTPRTDADRSKFLAELAEKTGQASIRDVDLASNNILDAAEARDEDKALDPRRLLIEADVAIARARNTVEEREQNVNKTRDQNLARLEAQHNRGAFPVAEDVVAEAEAKAAQSALKKAQIDLNAALARADAVREHLRTQQRLLQLKLDEANLELERARKEMERAHQLHAKQAISKGEYEDKELIQEQAKLKVRRAEMLLEAYRAAAEAKLDAGGARDAASGEDEETDEKIDKVRIEAEETEVEDRGEEKQEDIESPDDEPDANEETSEPGTVELHDEAMTDGDDSEAGAADENEDRTAVGQEDTESHDDEPGVKTMDDAFMIDEK